MARVIALSLVATDRMSRTFDDASKKVKGLDDALEKISKVGRVTGLAVAAAGALSLAKAIQPVIGAAAAMPAAMAAAAVATKTLKVGMQGVGNAMKAVASGDAKKLDAALKKLSPNAREFVKQTKDLQKSWEGVQRSVQDRLFQNLSSELKPLAKNVLPVLKRGMGDVAGSLNSVGQQAINVANTKWFKGEVNQIFAGTAKVTTTLSGAVRPLMFIVLKLLNLGMPLAHQFAMWAVDGLRAAAGFIKSKDGAAKLHDIVNKSVGVLGQLGTILKNLIGGLGGLVNKAEAFNGSGDDMLTVLTNLTQKFNDWANSTAGQKQSAETFKLLGDVARQVIQILPGLLGPLKIIAQEVTNLPGPLRAVVVQLLSWSVIIGLLGPKVKMLMLAGAGLKTMSGGFKALGVGIKGLAAAPSTIAGVVRGFRNVDAAFVTGANAGTTFGAAVRSQLQLMRQQAAAALASARNTAALAVSWLRAKAVMAGNWVMGAVTSLRAFAAAQMAAARATLATVVATVRQKIATIASTIASVAIRAATIAWTAVQWLLNAALSANPIGLVVLAIVALIAIVVLCYKRFGWFRTMVQTVWAGIQAASMFAWNNVLKPIFNLIKWYIVNVVIAYYKLLWSIAKIVWSGIVAVAKWAWNTVIKPIFNLIKWYIVNVVIAYFKLLWSVAKVIWNGISAAIRFVWNNGIKPAFNGIKAGVHAVHTAFDIAVKGIKAVWDKLKGYTRAPISFFVNTVYMGGVRKVWEGVRKLVPALPDLPAVKFATGGTVPGYAPGRDSVLAMLSPGEGIIRPEATRALGQGWITRVNKAAKSGGVGAVQRIVGGVGDPGGLGIPGFADGGIIGLLKKPINWAKNAGSSILSKGADWFAHSILDPIKAHIPGGGPGLWGKAIGTLPRQMIDGFIGFIKKVVSPNMGGGGSTKAVSAIRKVIGTPYSWGGGGPFGPSRGIGRGAGTVGFDCSSLMQYGLYQAYHKIAPRTTYAQRPWLRQISKPVPGAIGQPHPGHTYMYSGNGKIIEAPFTGGFVREVPMRSTPFWGLPPWKMDKGGNLPAKSISLIHNGTNHGEMVMTRHQQTLMKTALEVTTAGRGLQQMPTNVIINAPVGSDPYLIGKTLANYLKEFHRRGGKNPFA